MSKLIVKKGRTSLLVRVFIQDSSSVVGAGLTGLTSGSGSLVCYRARDDDGNAGATQITLSGGTRGTWSSGGFVEKDATNMPGWYELGVPDNAIASGTETVSIELKGATNMAPCVFEIQLVAFDPQDSVRLGLTALPNASAGAAGGVLTVGNMRQQKNAALSNLCFYMADSSGAPKTGLTITSNISKDGGGMTGTSNSASEISSGLGWYKINLTQTEMNADVIALSFAGSGALNTNIFINTQVD